MRLRAATRGSPLARWQADHVAALLSAVDPALEHEAVVVTTTGDRDRTRPLAEIGGKGVFVKEVQAAVLDGRADLAVHSAKDLPSTTPDGLVIAAVPERADPRDALVGRALADLPPGSRIATGSARRRSQLAAHRPDLTFVGLRGNMDTRLGRRRRPRRRGRGHRRPRPPGSLGGGGRGPGPARSSCPRRARAPWPSSAGPTTRRPGPCWPPSTTSPATGPCGPSGPSWPSSAATATSRPGPTPSSTATA